MPLILSPDPRRAFIRVPATILGLVAAGAAAAAIFLWLTHRDPGGALRPLTLAGAGYCYVRQVYVRRTRLILDDAGLELRQPLANRRASWAEVASVTVSSPYDLTHRGGVSAGVRVRLASTESFLIPDVFAAPRRTLAAMIEDRRRQHPETHLER